MARRSIHYEAAFEQLLRDQQRAYIAIDEARRSTPGGEGLKNFDFLVHRQPEVSWLCDVKGRRVQVGARGDVVGLQTWVSADDVDALRQWQVAFGAGFEAVFVFAFWIDAPVERVNASLVGELYLWQQRRYLFRVVPVAAYATVMRVRSPLWNTRHLSSQDFRALARPVALGTPPVAA